MGYQTLVVQGVTGTQDAEGQEYGAAATLSGPVPRRRAAVEAGDFALAEELHSELLVKHQEVMEVAQVPPLVPTIRARVTEVGSPCSVYTIR